MADGQKTKFIVDRIKEPSTWTGIAALALVFGINPETVNAVVQVIVTVAGVAAVFLKEGK